MRLPFDPDDYPIAFDNVAVVGVEHCSTPEPEPKMYVLVRRDLPWAVRCVQATHAVMRLQRDIGYKTGWGLYGPAVVLLGVKDEQELSEWLIKLNPHAVGFYEPDMAGQVTAAAYYGQPIESLSELRLM